MQFVRSCCSRLSGVSPIFDYVPVPVEVPVLVPMRDQDLMALCLKLARSA